jgi:multiple sugar transport system ATP-binding protein
MSDVALELVTKVYPNGVRALDDLTLAIPRGQFVTVVGPSGSGKTTLLRIIAGVEDLTSGTIRINNDVANHTPPWQRDVAIVFQRHTLYPHLNVRDNLAFALRMRYRDAWISRTFRWLRGSARTAQTEQLIQTRVMETAELLGLEELLGRMPYELSGGQQQRVALGKAIARRPAILLLDEPLSNLDAALRAELRRLLHLLHRQIPATIIYVTHDQVEAMALGDRMVVLDRGVLQQADAPQAVYERPSNRFVAGFVGWPPMNFIEGGLTNGASGPAFAGGGWNLPLAREEGLAERPVVLGLRPEDVGPEVDGSARLAMEVILVEPLGGERLVTLEKVTARVMARVRGRSDWPIGSMIEVGFDMRHAHWFDVASGRALTGPAG